MPVKDEPPTVDELPALAFDVTYEFRMALLAVEQLRGLGSPRKNDLLWSAWVEVLLLHSRVLADFFGLPPTGDDLVAGHYIDRWDLNAPDVEWLRGNKLVINKRVMHLTTYRHRQRDKVDGPEVEELLTRLTNTVVEFLERLNPERRDWFPIEVTGD